MSEKRWTIPQQQCIDARGGTVLVSAAAGSGKTAVLIERIVSLLCDREHPLDIDRLLVVTFTKAAAAEMRSRLNKRLASLLAQDPHNRHLLRQQMLLPQASICTIDSFCAQLLREQAQQVGISPRFRVAEDTALRLMKNDVADDVIEQAYAQNDPAFRRLCDTLAGDRGDAALKDQLLRTYDFIQAHPFPAHWLNKHQAAFESDVPLRETVWGRILLEQAKEDLTAAREMLAAALEDMVGDDRMQAAYGGSLTVSLQGTDRALAALECGWDDAVKAVQAIAFERVKALRGYEDEAFKAHITALRNHAKAHLEKTVKTYLISTEAAAKADIAAAAPLVKALFDLVREFSAAFSAAKTEQNVLDFNDMEHVALSLLAVPNEDGTYTRTEAAKEIGSRFSHIMVDEYQDTNATQDTLFSALSDDEKNLFFVGDIKQSIYGFRQAMPSIFRTRRERGTPYDGQSFPASITLGNNFRSRRQVTDSANALFRLLMTEKNGGIVYDEREELVSSASFANADDPAYDTELIVTSKNDVADGLSAQQAEARLIGQRILSMIAEGFCVSDGDGLRQVSYRDFCILLRSTARHGPVMTKELQAMGIPVATENRESFFDAAEIRLALSVLRTIDNPLQDIPLLATLLSPVGGFSPDDAAAVRESGRDVPLFQALRRIARQDHPLAEKCRGILTFLSDYRILAAAMPADQLIRRLYDDTDLSAVMSAKVGGAGRIANLRKLYDTARHFEQQDFRGLSAFIRHMDKLEARGIAVACASKDNDSQNAVKLMTVHHSKGLEFPVVFVAGLGSDFNTASVRDDVLLHADHGIGLKLRDRETLTEANPLHRQAIAAAITRSERTEELRVLYVAMTRAKDKLFLLATVDNLPSALERIAVAAGTAAPFSPSFVLRASHMSDWVLACAMRHPAGTPLTVTLRGDASQRDDACDGLRVHVTAAEELHELRHAALQDERTMELPALADRMAFAYPYAPLGQIAAKITASETAHRRRKDGTAMPLPQPAFLSKSGLSPAQRGTATHLFLEHADLSATLSAEEQAGRMVESGVLTAQQKEALRLSRLQRFLQSDTAKRMAASPALLREFPFAVERPIADFAEDMQALPADAATETVLVQGIADAVFEEDGALVIVDYKTDRVQSGDELIERYRPQLEIYKEALSRTLQKPVKTCLLYSFHLNETVEIR